MSDPITILPYAESDVAIPANAAILARAADLRADAVQQRDTARVRQLDHLRDALRSGVRMAWNLGDLLVSSASTPGAHYVVSCGRCNCPAYKPCKHLALFDILIDMLDTDAGDADFEIEPETPDPQPWRIGAFLARQIDASGRAALARRICAARSRCILEVA